MITDILKLQAINEPPQTYTKSCVVHALFWGEVPQLQSTSKGAKQYRAEF